MGDAAKMVVWEDTEFTSPHNWGTCRMLVGDLDTQGDGRNPQVNRKDMGGLRGEEKWRPDRTSTPEGWLGGGSGSHAWRDPRGLGLGERAQRFPCPVSLEACPALRLGPMPSEALLQPHWSWWHRREGRGRTGEAGGRGPPGLEEWERSRGQLPTYSGPGSLLGSQAGAPTL